jgi:HK97 family phage prohead protease
MNATTQAGMDRLDEVLNAPAGPSRHAQALELARERAAAEPRDDRIVKAVAAVAEPVEDAALSGEFVALVSDFLPDRQMETFVSGAWTKALNKIKEAGRSVPILFGHSLDSPTSVLGAVPASGWQATDAGLLARGWIDVTDPIGLKVFKMLRRGALSWSVGFTLAKSRPGRAGVRELVEVDELLELSAVPVPANERTRTVSAKSSEPERRREPPSLEELRELERGLRIEDEHSRLREQIRAEFREVLANYEPRNEPRTNGDAKRASLRLRKARDERHELDHLPVQIASFDA